MKTQGGWGTQDPTEKSKDEFIKTAEFIKEKVLDLKKRIPVIMSSHIYLEK